MSDFATLLIEALQANRYVVLGDPHHGSASFESIVEAVTHEAGQNQVALISVLQDTEILLENLRVGQQSQHKDIDDSIAALLKHKIVVTGCETAKSLSAEGPLADAESRKDIQKSRELALQRVTDANSEWESQAKASTKKHVVVCCGTAHVPRCHCGGVVVDVGFCARLQRHGPAVGYAVVHKNNKTDQTYIPEKQPQPADDMFDPVAILEPFDLEADDGSDGDET